MLHSLSSDSSAERQIFTVSSLNAAVRRLLESQWGSVWLLGEISNFSAPHSGHWYFTLKDPQAQVRCAMFRGNNARVAMRVGNGLQVLVRGRLSLYEPRGDYQLIIDRIEPAGEGLLQLQYEQLKAKLSHEGLFAIERKKELPKRLRRVGVITSPTGAAIQDIISVLRRRDPQIQIIIYPSSVQGREATVQLRRALARALTRNEVDVLIIARGGGSLEDMQCFNDEQLARELHNSQIVTLSAVGHESDTCILDYVADLRAPTPSAAAELVSADYSERAKFLLHLKTRINYAVSTRFKSYRQAFKYNKENLYRNNPEQQLNRRSQTLDDLTSRYQRSMANTLSATKKRWEHTEERLNIANIQKSIMSLNNYHDSVEKRLYLAINHQLKNANQKSKTMLRALNLVSPLAVLSRGYSITLSEGAIIKSCNIVTQGQTITTQLSDGYIESEVISIKKRANP